MVKQEIGYRLIETHYPSITIFDDCETEDELRDVLALKLSVNPRINELSKYIDFGDIPYGIGGISYAVTPFIFNDHGGRFNSPHVGCLYSAKETETAMAEVRYHRSRYLADNPKFKYDAVEYRVLKVDFEVSEEAWFDITDKGMDDPLYDLDPSLYGVPQAFGAKLIKEGAECLCFNSVRKPGGTNYALFTPKIIRKVTQCELKILISEGENLHWGDY